MRSWLEGCQQDLRYAIRGLARAPGFTATVMLTLGLGIGANAAMFGVIDRLMFRPFPFLHAPSAVHRVYLQTSISGPLVTRSTFPYTRYADLQRWTTSFDRAAAISEWTLAVGSGDAARERQVVGVSASFFDFFDMRPAVGRFFDRSEDVVPRGANVAVLGYAYWQSALGGGNVVGRTLQVGPLVTTIIGVAPKGFVGVGEGQAPAVFLPITTLAYGVNQGDAQSFARRYNWDFASMIVRRKVAVTAAAATADLTQAYIQSRNAQRSQNPNVASAAVAHPRALVGAVRVAGGPDAGLEARTLLWVGGVAVIVLLIACANVANLLLARVLRRRREIAVRLALGVSWRRLVRQFATEGLLLAGLGGAAGLGFALSVSALVGRLFIHDGTTFGLVANGRTFVVAGVAALACAVFTSLAPTILALRGNLAAMVRAGAREGTHQRSRLRSSLLVLQGALSVVLLVGAGLFVRSLDNVRSMPLGWEPERVLVVTPNLRGVQMDTAAQTAFRRRLLATAQSIPGVEAAARVNSLPFLTNTYDLHVDGVDSVARLGRFIYQATTPDYFKTVGTPVVRGEGFTSRDRADTPPVAVVSESMARALWPSTDAIGQCLRIGGATATCTRVIGVAEDAVQQTMVDDRRFVYYLSDEQPPQRPSNRIFVRLSMPDVTTEIERIRRAMQAAMPSPAYVTVGPLEDLVDQQRRSWQLGATMFVSFGGLALLVAAVGLYGVIGYNVAQRMHELGVRIALGAQWRDIVRLVMTQAVFFAGAGIATGTLVALLIARWIQPLLFKQSAMDPTILSAVGAVIAVVSLGASVVPAVRATRADPNQALRSD